MKTLLLMGLMFVSSVAAANPADKSCGKFPPDYIISRPLGIDEIERYEMAIISAMRKSMSEIPNAPFGFQNAAWVDFKSRVRPGDKIVSYNTDRRAWQNLAGETGYALMRSGCLIESFMTRQN